MNKMKKFFYMAMAAIAALSSCSSDDAILNEGGQNENGVTTFIATIEGDNATRATYDATNRKALWEANTDQISIGGKVYTAQTTGATTTFSGSGASVGADSKYHAYFPASLYCGTTASLPATMPLEDGKFNMPMYAESATEEFTFKNLCGVLAITVPNTQMSSVKSIEVSSDKQMNGEISSISAAGVLTFATTTLTAAHKKITLTAASPISIPAEGSKTFYVPVPANTHNPLKITISNETHTKEMVTTKTGGVQVVRNTMYSINFDGTPIAAWETKLTLGKSDATSIVIETGVASLPTAEVTGTSQKLNTAGTLWAVLSTDGKTLKIQTSAPKIKGHGPFGGYGLFDGYTKVTSITDLDKIDFSEVTDMSYMFSSCEALTSVNMLSFNTSEVTKMKSMFSGCEALTSLDLSSFNTSKVTSMAGMFDACNALTSLNLSNFNTSNVTDMQFMFNNCNALTSLNLSNFDTSEVTNMANMFCGCNALTSLTLSPSFNTSKVTDMQSMFYNCNALTSLDLSSFNTSNVTTMYYMFYNCNALTSLTLSSSFNTSKVTYMQSMFFGCNALTSLDLSSFNTSNVTNMYNMFSGCTALTSLTLSPSFNTSNVTDMHSMFYNCNALTSLDLSSFNTSNVTSIYYMFYNCNKLSALTLSNNFVMTSVIDKMYMFTGCGTQATGGKCTVSGVTDSAVKTALKNVPSWGSNMQFAN